MNGILLLIICEFAALAIVVVVLFARLSYHYARMYRIVPDMAREFQERFSRQPIQPPPAIGTAPGHPEIAYRPHAQIAYLARIRRERVGDDQVRAAITAVITDLRLTLAWLGLCLVLGLSTIASLLF